MFQKAVKYEEKLRMAIAGPSGSGKTYTSLKIASAMANGGKVAVVDTEHGSATKYAELFDFDTLPIGPGAKLPDGQASPFQDYNPANFVKAVKMAKDAGYDVIVLDSLSHAWNGTGGMLQLVDNISKKYRGNSYAAWSEGTPIQNSLIECLLSTDVHIIATMRSKQDHILVEKKGKQIPQKVGMAPIQRDGFEYEFDVFLDMDIDNNAMVSKTRCTELTGQVIPKPGENLAHTLTQWLRGEKKPVSKQHELEPSGVEELVEELEELKQQSDEDKFKEWYHNLDDWLKEVYKKPEQFFEVLASESYRWENQFAVRSAFAKIFGKDQLVPIEKTREQGISRIHLAIKMKMYDDLRGAGMDTDKSVSGMWSQYRSRTSENEWSL